VLILLPKAQAARECNLCGENMAENKNPSLFTKIALLGLSALPGQTIAQQSKPIIPPKPAIISQQVTSDSLKTLTSALNIVESETGLHFHAEPRGFVAKLTSEQAANFRKLPKEITDKLPFKFIIGRFGADELKILEPEKLDLQQFPHEFYKFALALQDIKNNHTVHLESDVQRVIKNPITLYSDKFIINSAIWDKLTKNDILSPVEREGLKPLIQQLGKATIEHLEFKTAEYGYDIRTVIGPYNKELPSESDIYNQAGLLILASLSLNPSIEKTLAKENYSIAYTVDLAHLRTPGILVQANRLNPSQTLHALTPIEQEFIKSEIKRQQPIVKNPYEKQIRLFNKRTSFTGLTFESQGNDLVTYLSETQEKHYQEFTPREKKRLFEWMFYPDYEQAGIHAKVNEQQKKITINIDEYLKRGIGPGFFPLPPFTENAYRIGRVLEEGFKNIKEIDDIMLWIEKSEPFKTHIVLSKETVKAIGDDLENYRLPENEKEAAIKEGQRFMAYLKAQNIPPEAILGKQDPIAGKNEIRVGATLIYRQAYKDNEFSISLSDMQRNVAENNGEWIEKAMMPPKAEKQIPEPPNLPKKFKEIIQPPSTDHIKNPGGRGM
jgi:hypothetical protein